MCECIVLYFYTCCLCVVKVPISREISTSLYLSYKLSEVLKDIREIKRLYDFIKY